MGMAEVTMLHALGTGKAELSPLLEAKLSSLATLQGWHVVTATRCEQCSQLRRWRRPPWR
jgi:hypothetical protein